MDNNGKNKNFKQLNEVQETFIKQFIMQCKSENVELLEEVTVEEEIIDWNPTNSKMVGFYKEISIPSIQLAQSTSADGDLLVKRLVCSPDLPIPSYPNSNSIHNSNQATNQQPQPQQHQHQQQISALSPSTAQPQSSAPGASAGSLQCTLCNKMFASKSSFQAHQRTHQQKDAEDPYRCNICAKTFAVPARLTRHYRTHTGEKPFRCEFCNKSFSVKENLSVHRRIHTKERPYKCEVCSRAFEHSGKLHRHMRIHTGERPHKCTVCSKTFIQSGQLVIHMRTHTGEKPYVCSVCQKGFTCSKQLKVHSRTHTGEKPYSCEICGKSFGYNHVLKLHQVAHYGEKVYKCTICNDTFTSKKNMEAHIKSHSDNATTPASPPQSTSPTISTDSFASSSDKENSEAPSSPPSSISPMPLNLKQVDVIPSVVGNGPAVSYDHDIRYYICGTRNNNERSLSPTTTFSYASSGVELLAAAASVRERVHDTIISSSSMAAEEATSTADMAGVLNLISRGNQDAVVAALRQHPAYFTVPVPVPAVHHHYEAALPQLHAGDDIRRRVEAALAGAEPMLTPPSSNPVSPAPSVSPDPELSLPPRKRSKMILKSMESTTMMMTPSTTKELSPVRYNSVIQYARAS